MRKTYNSTYDVRDDMLRTLNTIYKEKALEEWDSDLAVSEDYANVIKQQPEYPPSEVRTMLTNLMDHLRETGQDDFVLLKHPEIAEWYGTVLEKRRVERVRQEAKDKFKEFFSKEEQKLLRDMIRMG